MIAQEAQYRDWMLAALMGDAGAYRMLLAGLTRHLRSYYARRLDGGAAEDAVQETLIAIHTRRATYDPALPFTAWVYGIARYKLIDEYRRHKRRATVPLDEAADLFGHDDATDAIAKRDVTKLLDQAAARQAPTGEGHQAGRRQRGGRGGAHGPVGIGGEGDGAPRHQVAGRRVGGSDDADR